MTGPVMLVGLGATKAAWSGELRGYIRDHVTSMTAATVLDSGQLARNGQRRFDVVVLDDVSRIFGAGDVVPAVAAGTVVIGLYGTEGGLGREWLEGLGVSRLLPVTLPVVELAAMIAEVGPINAGPSPVQDAAPAGAGRGRGKRRGLLTVVSSVSGGAGLTEGLVGLAESWAKRSRVLVIEANPTSAVLGFRLGRETSWGLGWVLGRVAQGQRVLPEGLSPARSETVRALGAFDVICGSATPGGPAPIDGVHLDVLVNQALAIYGHVLVEVGPLLVSPPAGSAQDRFAAGRVMLGRADQAMVFASPDPEAAARLVEWRAAAFELEVNAPAWAVFGRFPHRGGYEWSHLVEMVERWTRRTPFAGVRRLPEDPVVGRARWNGELVWRGRWLAAIERLATELAAAPAAPPVAPPAADGAVVREQRLTLASEVGW